jgi:hypothetical protein
LRGLEVEGEEKGRERFGGAARAHLMFKGDLKEDF